MKGFSAGAFGTLPFGLATPDVSVINWRPMIGATISRLDTIEFDVIDGVDGAARTLLVRAIFVNGIAESVFSDGKFSELYRRGSARRQIQTGGHYILRRTTGWAGSDVRIDVRLVDE